MPVFVGVDAKGVPRHAHKRGTFTQGQPYKGNVGGSSPGYSFHYIGQSDRVYVFEALIDLLSFISKSLNLPVENRQPDSLPDKESSRVQPSAPTSPQSESTEKEAAQMKWTVQVDGQTFTATPEDNDAAEALTEMMREAPVVIQMSDYSGFEKVGPLGLSLPTSNSQTTTQAGDIVLYQGNQVVIFYGSNSWSYTRLGRIEDLNGWEEALGSGDVTVTFSMGE